LSRTPSVLRMESEVPLDVNLIDVRLTESQGPSKCPSE
jgi:hypothetical protein